MIDPQDQHNHNEIPSIFCLIDLNNTVKPSVLAGANLKQMASSLFGKNLGTSRAIKQVKVCMDYNGLLGLFLSYQGLIDYLSDGAEDVQ